MPVPSWKTELKTVAQDVYAYTQAGGPGVDNNGVSNAGCIIGPDRVVVIDALQAPIPAKNFIAEIRKITKLPFSQLVNTHFHGDHTAGNQFFMPTEIIASEKCREFVISTGVPANVWPTRPGLAVGGEPRLLTPPTTTIPTGVATLYVKDMRIELHAFDPAHSPGDVVVYIPERKLVFGGDCCFFYVAPVFITGTCAGNIRVIDWIDSLDVDVIVPGHGPVGTKKDMAINRRYLTLIQAQARERYDAGLSAVDAAATIDMGEYTDWPDAKMRLMNNVQRLYMEFALKPYDIISPQERAAALTAYQAKVGM